MIYLLSIFLGVIQGLTEFLPISSSGHLVILHDILRVDVQNDLLFDVILHWGTLIALLVYFYKDIIKYFQAFLKSFVKWDPQHNPDEKIAWLILLSMIPAVIVGYFLEDVITNFFRSSLAVVIVLIVVSFLFILVEKYAKQKSEMNDLDWQKSILIGLAQAAALIPGASRSGLTIITGMTLNLKREAAARFSFLMSIPIVMAAGLKKFLDAYQSNLHVNDYWPYVLGLLSAAIVGYFCIKYFLQLVQRYSLNWFAYYRLALGIIILIFLAIK